MELYHSSHNPILPPELCIPDAEAHVFGDRLFLYGSHDQTPGRYCSEDYHVISTADMETWQIGDVALHSADVPWISERNPYPIEDMDARHPTAAFANMVRASGFELESIPPEQRPENLNLSDYLPERELLYAPDCAERDGKYYLFFCTSGYLEGVAVADDPHGPFHDPKQLPCAGIDPAVFLDDDGTVYYFWGQFRSAGARLTQDMQSIEPSSVVRHLLTEEEHGFHEGSSLRKRNGIYYYVYPCVTREGKPTCLAYATAERPFGPYTYRGIIIDNAKCDPQSWNIHGSIEQFHGQWYVFYHRSSGNSQTQRRLCIEPIEFLPDGSIPEVKMTSIGPGRPFQSGERIEGWRACEVEGGAYTEGCVLHMTPGSTAVFRYVELIEPLKSVEVERAGNASICVFLNGKAAEPGFAPGRYELSLTSDKDCVIHSLTVQ